MISPLQISDFVAHMELVLDEYKTPKNTAISVICMDESPKQLTKETRLPIERKPGSDAKEDYEYEGCGVANIFMANEPLTGKRYVKVTNKKTRIDLAHFKKEIADVHYPTSEKIKLVMDNYGTHKPSALYEAFAAEEAKRIYLNLSIHPNMEAG